MSLFRSVLYLFVGNVRASTLHYIQIDRRLKMKEAIVSRERAKKETKTKETSRDCVRI